MDKLKAFWKRNKGGLLVVIVSFASVAAFLLYIQAAFSSPQLTQTEIFLQLWKPLGVLGLIAIGGAWAMRD